MKWSTQKNTIISKFENYQSRFYWNSFHVLQDNGRCYRHLTLTSAVLYPQGFSNCEIQYLSRVTKIVLKTFTHKC